jgi:hypothetical protein
MITSTGAVLFYIQVQPLLCSILLVFVILSLAARCCRSVSIVYELHVRCVVQADQGAQERPVAVGPLLLELAGDRPLRLRP